MASISRALGVGVLSLLLCSSPALRASVILENDAAFDFLGTAQDGFNITRDVDNNLEWLDWTLTTGRSFNDVSAALGTGNTLEGWRYATGVELRDLAISAGVLAALIDHSGALNAAVTALANALGITHTSSSTGSSIQWPAAIFADIGQNQNTHRLGGVRVGNATQSITTIDVPNDPTFIFNQKWPDANVNLTIGSALVRDGSVPEPGTLVLLALGVAGIGFGRRRKTPKMI